MTTIATPNPARDELKRMIQLARVPRVRSMQRFAEDEITMPDGPYGGFRFRCSRQPFTRLFFDEHESGRWNRYLITGDQQSGKSTIGHAIPILYHLFELRESVVMGVHDEHMGADKVQNTIMPVLRRTRYVRYLPTSGGGSRGGKARKYIFTNGATLRIMTSGGGDKGRAAFTTRVVAATEIDGMDTSGGSSREGDKLSQIEGRTSAFDDRAAIYLECTVSIERGRTWREYTGGTESRIVVPCPHCGEWVTPEREHLKGWQDADDEYEARDRGRFHCPECDEPITDEQRREMNQECRLVHKGQTITAGGEVVGDLPRTRTLGFRWNAFNNLMKSTARIAAFEWRCDQDPDEDNAEKVRSQFWWAKPYAPPETSIEPMTMYGIASRQRNVPRGIAPQNTELITVGIDLGAHLCYWVSLAWLPDGSPHVVDYGYIDVPSREFALEVALLSALRQFRDDVLMDGWPVAGTPDEADKLVPQAVLVDAGHWQELALEFAAETHGVYGSKGRGAGQWNSSIYRAPKRVSSNVLYLGDGYHIAAVVSNRRRHKLVEVNVDTWKMWTHLRFQTRIGEAGGITLPHAEKVREHYTFAKHILAETWDEKTRKWTRGGQNHFLDATTLAGVAGHLAGVRLKTSDESGEAEESPKSAPPRRRRSRTDGAETRSSDAWRPKPVEVVR